MDRFIDVVDEPGAPLMTLGSGATRAVTPGSWIVNCTGYLLRDLEPYEPYISPTGRVLSIQPRSATLHLTSYMAYFMTHMLFLGDVAHAPLYELDAVDLRRKSKLALPFGLLVVAQYNLSVMYERLPTRVFLDCGLNVDRWYPLTRQMLGSLRFVATHRRDRKSAKRTLDTLRDRFDIRCGPLPSAT